MTNIAAIFLKQAKDTLKNKVILIQFVLFPVLAVLMENTVKLEDMPEHFFVKLFSVMYICMAPLTCASSVISEEKEANTLRVLMMSDVSPAQYLVGEGAFIWLACMLGSCVFAACGEYAGVRLVQFMAYMAAGILVSLLIGAALGMWCRGQMAAASAAVPLTMLISFLPMLSMFNETIEKISRFSYSQQISVLIGTIGTDANGTKSLFVLGANFLAAAVIFFAAYRKRGLE